MAAICRVLFYFLFVKPVAFLILGLNVDRPDRLPRSGPAILAANHNSHLDIVLLLSLFPFRTAMKIRPVAAADYFLRNGLLAWFSRRVLRIVAVDRTRRAAGEMLREISAALAAGEIVLLFPEGTRGEAEVMGDLQPGIAHVAKMHASVPVIPVYVYGAGKALPRGETVLVPFFCDVLVGEPVRWHGDRSAFLRELDGRLHDLAAEGEFPLWT